jgi:alpha-beta hydrolase superfamily lysophospholipase
MRRRKSSGGTIGIAAIAIGLVVTTIALVAGATAAITVRFARKVVTPPRKREEDVRILRIDLAGEEITLAASDESGMAGRYGFWFDHDAGHARLGEVVAVDDRTVRRRIDSVDFGRLDRAARGRMNGWYHLGPWELGFPYENVLVETALGPSPAWLVRTAEPSTRWVIQVHGRGAKRPEGLRAVPPAREAGWNTLLISYRNDGEAPESEDRRYGLGGTEWADVVAAVEFAVEHGAEQVVLMGWSMGGMISLQAVLRSAEVREPLVGVILDSPAIDWVDILRSQGRAYGFPSELGDAVSRLLGGPLSGGLTGIAAPISVEELDPVARAEEFTVPILLMHSVDDGFVPIDGSRRFAQARPDLIEFEVFEGARHTKLWNHDPVRWTGLVHEWLERRTKGVDRLGDEAEIVG